MTPQWDAMTGYYKEYAADIIRSKTNRCIRRDDGKMG